jgi:hypothetical protein
VFPATTSSTTGIPIESESLDSIKSWIENEKRIDALKILAVLEMAKASQFPSLAVLHKAAEVANVDDTGRKYEHLIHRTIDQLEKRDFYQQHLDMVELRHQRRQNEGLKRFEIALRMPVGYYWGSKCFSHASSSKSVLTKLYYLVHTELTPEILWIGDHREH